MGIRLLTLGILAVLFWACEKPCTPGPGVNCEVTKANFDAIQIGDALESVQVKLGHANLWLPEGSPEYASQIIDPHGNYTWYRRDPYVNPVPTEAAIHLVTKRGIVVEKRYSED